MKIGLISDTHGYLDEKTFSYFKECDEIWHAGDFGTIEVAQKLAEFKPLVGVYGNIDNNTIRQEFPEQQNIEREGLHILMMHIGGSPPRYNPRSKKIIKTKMPDIFICGHSHILKVMNDQSMNLLYINPGAAGFQGFHKIRTLIRFDINNSKPQNMEVVELGKRGSL